MCGICDDLAPQCPNAFWDGDGDDCRVCDEWDPEDTAWLEKLLNEISPNEGYSAEAKPGTKEAERNRAEPVKATLSIGRAPLLWPFGPASFL